MKITTISPKYQIVIPKAIRTSLGLQPGQKMQIFRHENRIELIPIKPASEMRGFLKGIKTTVPREDDRI